MELRHLRAFAKPGGGLQDWTSHGSGASLYRRRAAARARLTPGKQGKDGEYRRPPDTMRTTRDRIWRLVEPMRCFRHSDPSSLHALLPFATHYAF